MGIRLTLNKPIPQSADYLQRCMSNSFFELTFNGGWEYKYGKDAQGQPTLVQQRAEPDDAYETRRRLSIYPNYSQDILKRYNSYVFGNSVRRDMSEAFVNWSKDVDTRGTSLHDFMQFATLQAQKMGLYFIIVDSTKEEEKQSASQELYSGDQMYLTYLHPNRVVNFIEENGYYSEILVHFPAQQMLRLYTETTYQNAYLSVNNNITRIDAPVAYAKGGMPIICVYANSDRLSQLKDIAEYNKGIFNTDSQLREELANRVFTQHYGVGFSKDDITESVIIGGRKVFLIPMKTPAEADFKQVTADVSQAEALAKKINDDIKQIYTKAGLYAFDSGAVGSHASGTALDIKFNAVSLNAAAISKQAEKAENEIIKWYNDFYQTDIAPSDYADSDEMDVTAFADELKATLDILSSDLPTTIKTEQVRVFAATAYPTLSAEKQIALEQELLDLFSDEESDETDDATNDDAEAKLEETDAVPPPAE